MKTIATENVIRADEVLSAISPGEELDLTELLCRVLIKRGHTEINADVILLARKLDFPMRAVVWRLVPSHLEWTATRRVKLLS